MQTTDPLQCLRTTLFDFLIAENPGSFERSDQAPEGGGFQALFSASRRSPRSFARAEIETGYPDCSIAALPGAHPLAWQSHRRTDIGRHDRGTPARHPIREHSTPQPVSWEPGKNLYWDIDKVWVRYRQSLYSASRY